MCDCEPAEARTTRIRKARVAHLCCECGVEIAPGNQYEYVSGIWSGTGMDFKTCLVCVGIRHWYVAECLPMGECWPCFGSLIEDATDHGNAGTREELVQAATTAGYLPQQPEIAAAVTN